MQWHSTSDTNDFVDFQIWLFEADNHIEVHFGSSSTDPGTYGYPVATSDPNPGTSFKFLFDTCNNMFGLNGPANLPSYLFFNSCVPNYVFINGTPSSGITYVLNPTGIGVNEFEEISFNVYPNPASDFLMITDLQNRSEVSRIEISDCIGNTILTQEDFEKQSSSVRIPLESFSDGLYVLKVYDKNGNAKAQKIIKKSR